MIIEQTVEIPANRRLFIEVPPEIPAGRAVLTFRNIVPPSDTVLLSEVSLAKDWNTPEEDSAWANL